MRNDFSSTSLKRGRGRGRVRGRGSKVRGRRSSSSKGNFHCTYCNKYGHLISHLFQKKRDTSHSNFSTKEGENSQT